MDVFKHTLYRHLSLFLTDLNVFADDCNVFHFSTQTFCIWEYEVVSGYLLNLRKQASTFIYLFALKYMYKGII